MFEQFPYANFHELNMDWIIKIAKDFLDQYTHIQEIIAQGEQSLSDKTTEGLAALGEKANELEALLQAWYDTHSEDIAQQLTAAIASFYSEADQKTAAAIASIPAEYSELAAMVDHLYDTNIFNFTKMPYTTTPGQTIQGITWSTLDDGTIKAVGTTTAAINAVNVYYYTTLPNGRLKPGTRVLLYQNSSNPSSLYMELFSKTTGGSLSPILNFKNQNGFTSWDIPANTETILWRAYALPNVALNDTILPAIVIFPENSNYFIKMNPDTPLGYDQFGNYWGGQDVDLNSITENSFYLLTDRGTYLHKPAQMSFGFLQCITSGRWHLQLAYDFTGGKIYKRRGTPDGSSWEDWQEISGGSTYNITNNYEYPSLTQNVQLTATPSITADTNQYLASTGDRTDRTADILAMLAANKICRLGPGVFYVNNLQMPEYSTLTGCGYITTVKLVDNVTGSAIKMNSYCTVENLRVEGANNVPAISSTVGDRHGIEWSGNSQTSSSDTKWRGMISNVYIRFFTGGGITCYNTGYGQYNGLEVTNTWIWRCGAGINISYLSEYHKFTNVCAQECYYGCINNGGNNVFVNCDFSSNIEYGFVIDNSQGQSPNNSHGSAIGCIFNHEYHNGVENSGTGIWIRGCQNGYVFTGCQLFFSKITIDNSSGVNFSDCNIGYSNCDISVSGGGLTIFNNLQFQDRPPISVSNNTQTHFINCYNRSNGAVIMN